MYEHGFWDSTHRTAQPHAALDHLRPRGSATFCQSTPISETGSLGYPVVDLPLVLAFLDPGPLQPKDLAESRPVQIVRQIGGGNQVPGISSAAMPLIDGAGLPPIRQRLRSRRRREQQLDRLVQPGLVVLDQQKVIPTSGQDLLTEIALTEQGHPQAGTRR